MGLRDDISGIRGNISQGVQNFRGTINSRAQEVGASIARDGIGNFAEASGTPFDGLDDDFNAALQPFDDGLAAFDSQLAGIFGNFDRLQGLTNQGIGPGAEATRPQSAIAEVVEGGTDSESNDWRVNLSVPTEIRSDPILSVFKGNRLVFPFNPTILFGASANYSQIHPTHSNYVYNAYENSQTDQITINAEFFNETEADCRYWIAVIHYLRTMTKMFYGEGSLSGNPPLLCRLNGYGSHVLNNIPVVISNFTTDMPNDIDYLGVDINGEINYVPTQSLVTVTVLPQYSRRNVSEFNLIDFAKGGFIGEPQGFV